MLCARPEVMPVSAAIEVLRRFMPLPRIEACRRVLCVQPHPDDTEIGAGGTVARLARSGAEVFYLTVTDGAAGTTDGSMDPQRLRALRRQEQEAAAQVLGVRTLLWLDYPDSGDYSEHRLRLEIIRAIRALRPDLVMTVDPFLPYEAHPDHLACGRAVAAAALLYRLPAIRTDPAVDDAFQPYPLAGVAFYHTVNPNAYVELSDDDWRLKFEAIACHKSQFDPVALEACRLYFDARSREYGAAIGVQRAEAFKVLPPQMLHCVVEAVGY